MSRLVGLGLLVLICVVSWDVIPSKGDNVVYWGGNIPYNYTLLNNRTVTEYVSGNLTYRTITIAVLVHGLDVEPLRLPREYGGLTVKSTFDVRFLRLIKAWRDDIRARGGLPSGPRRDIIVNFDFDIFNVGPGINATYVSPAITRCTQIASWLSDPNGPLGNYPIIFSMVASADALLNLFADACDRTRSCVFFNALASATTSFVCTADPSTGLVQSDCLARNRRNGDRRYEHTIAGLSAGGMVVAGHAAVLHSIGMRSACVLAAANSSGWANDALAATAPILASYKVDVRRFAQIPPAVNFALNPDLAMKEAIAVKNANPDVFFGLALTSDPLGRDNLVQMMAAFRKLNWLPKMVVAGGGWDRTAIGVYGDDATYTLGATPWSWRVRGFTYQVPNISSQFEVWPANPVDDSPQVFRKWLDARFGTDPLGDVGYVYTAIFSNTVTFTLKMVEAVGDVTNVQALLDASTRIYSASVYGRLQLDVWGRVAELEQFVTQNVLAGASVLITPLSVGDPLIYPMPTWDERVYIPKWYGTPIEQVVLAINSFCILYALLIMLLIWHHRDNNVIRAATPSFCMLVIAGAIVMQSAVYLFPLRATNSLCLSYMWLLTVGFTTMFSALFTKTFRVWKIFTAKLHIAKVGTGDLLSIMAIIMTVEVVLNAIWSGVSPPVNVLTVPDYLRPALNYEQCNVDDVGRGFIIASLVIKGTLIFGGIILTWLSRDVPSQFNETTFIAAAIYNVAFVMIFLIPIIASQVAGIGGNYIMRSFGVIFVCTATVSLLFIPKFYFIYFSGGTANYAVRNVTNLTIGTAADSIGDFQPSQADFNVSKLPPPAPAPSRDANWSGYGDPYNKTGAGPSYAGGGQTGSFKRPGGIPNATTPTNDESASLLLKLKTEIATYINVIHQLAQKLRQYEPSFVDKIFSTYNVPQTPETPINLPNAAV